MSTRKAKLVADLESVRQKTLELLAQVPDDYLKRRVHNFYSPIGWHFGHIGRTEEFWVLKEALGEPCLSDALSFVFADLPENPKDSRTNIPSKDEIIGYLCETRERSLEALRSATLVTDNPYLCDGYAWEFAIQHECQHQETIAEMLQLIQKDSHTPSTADPIPWATELTERYVVVPAGEFMMGSDDIHGYDNEKCQHLVQVGKFKLGSNAVTAYQWSDFVQDGGYCRQELWSDEGWNWRVTENASGPEYWVLQEGAYYTEGAIGRRPLHPNEPAMSLSWFEADAYARWKSKRLPTECEWEYAASLYSQPEDACCGMSQLQPATINGVPFSDLSGNAWEWTSSKFLPYTGFQAFPYDGYSKDHMYGKHYVCRGGSWATSPRLLRRSFRNWYVPTYRQGLLGMRLAEDC